MSTLMDDEIKRWFWKLSRGSRLSLRPVERTTFHPQRSRSGWRMASEAWRTRFVPTLRDDQYEKQLKELQEAYGEAMLELRVRKKLESLLGEDGK
jgi:hypothetical protein